jgi:Flp pilus assembly pilin Flp
MNRPRLARRCRDESGATSTEYALLVSLIALFIFGSVALFGTGLTGLYDRSCANLSVATAGTGC